MSERLEPCPSGDEVERVARAICKADGGRPEMMHAYRHSARAAIAAMPSRADILEEAAKIAESGCLVPPDGGSPTEVERELCNSIAAAIRAKAKDRT